MAEQLAGLLPLLLMIAVGYLLIIRPMRKRQREMVSVQRQLSPGVQVMTTSGLYATVREVTDARVVLETSPGVHSSWARNAVARVEAPTDVTAPTDRLDRAVDITDGATNPANRAASAAVTEQGADGRRTDRPAS